MRDNCVCATNARKSGGLTEAAEFNGASASARDFVNGVRELFVADVAVVCSIEQNNCITYDIDANGILKVSAFDEVLHKEANITITSSSGLSKEEIERAKADAEAHAAEDEKRLELVNEKNRAESLCNSVEKALKDAPADKITEDEKKPVLDAVAKTRETLKSDDVQTVKSGIEAMMKLYEPLASKLYAGTGGAPGGQQFSKEQMEQMMNDPKFKEMFGGGGFDPSKFGGGNAAGGQAGGTNDSTVDAEFTS